MSNHHCTQFSYYSAANTFIEVIRPKTSSLVNVLLTWPDLLGLHLVTHFAT